MIMRKHITRMTLREKCAQMVFVDFRFDAPDYDRTMRLVKKDGIGGLCLCGGSIFDVTPLVNSYQRAAKYPLLMAADFENGAGQQVAGATVFPPNLAVGAAGSEDLAHLKGRQTGLEARLLGIPWVLAPVVDVNRGPLGPEADTRSFGEDPALVGKLGRATLRGLHAAGVLGCAKHFPGRGDAESGSPAGQPPPEAALDRLQGAELLPFQEMIPEVDSIMVGHLLVRTADPPVPASLSRPVIEDLLRLRLKFEGLVATGALGAGEISLFCPEPEAVERAALAGADVLFCPGEPERAIGALEEAVRAGRLPEAAVDRAVDRILEAKEKRGLFRERIADVRSVESIMKNDAHRVGAQKIADAAVTLVRGIGNVEGAVEVLTAGAAGAPGGLTVFEKELSRKVKLQEGAPACVAAVFSRPDGPRIERLREAGRRCGRVVVVSFGSPAVILDFPDAAGFVCAYGGDEYCQRAAARALLGEIPFQGRLPATLGT